MLLTSLTYPQGTPRYTSVKVVDLILGLGITNGARKVYSFMEGPTRIIS